MYLSSIFKQHHQQEAEFPDVHTGGFADLFAEGKSFPAFSYKNMLRCLFGMMNDDGFFFVLSYAGADAEDLYSRVDDFRREFRLYAPYVFLFVRASFGDYFFGNDTPKQIDCLEDAVRTLAKNVQMPQRVLRCYEDNGPDDLPFLVIDDTEDHSEKEAVSTGIFYRKPSKRELGDGIFLFERFLQQSEESPSRKRKVTEDGTVYEKHAVTRFGVAVGEAWYPVADDDPDRFFLLTLLGGLFGAHKFRTGQWGTGLFYLFTLGGLGILYVSDLLSIATGTYHIRQSVWNEEDDGHISKSERKIYMGRPVSVLRSIAGCAVATAAAFLIITQIYFPLIGGIGRTLGHTAANKLQSAETSVSEQITQTISDSSAQ